MKTILLIPFIIVGVSTVNAQTVKEIDSLRNSVLENLDRYTCVQYFDKEISNEDAVGYDTAYFYHDGKGNLVYMKWRERSHTFHISGDAIDITELLFSNGKVVFERSLGYQFLNPQWHKEEDINGVKISVVESKRNYYKEDGTALMDYRSRKTEGKYKDRFHLLDEVPLEETRRLIWSNRNDSWTEENYLSVYRELLKKD